MHVPNLDNTPRIHYHHHSKNLDKLNGEPFNLTADVASTLPLTSLYWSPPKYSAPLPNRTIIFSHDDITTATFMMLKNASKNDSGYYTLTVANKCGQISSEVYVNVIGKIYLSR